MQAIIERRFGGVQARFGTAIGRQSDYVSRLLTGKKALGERLARDIERILGLEPGELDHEPLPLDRLDPTPVPLQLRGAAVPVYAWENVVHLDHGTTMNSAVAPLEYAPRPAGVSEHAYALVVRGPAMEPEFRDGWRVYVEPGAPVKHGDFVVALPEGRKIPVLRQLSIEGDTTYLRCLNPQYPEPMIPLGAGRIIGRVVYQGQAY